ncbi:MAG: ribosome silencing factor [Candidatus Marinimicrobia bacterium]|nr:ribosome silencing factor [Candidatus Neomarinimicrobiota bacterium]
MAHLALLKKAENILIMDVRKITSMTDYFIICSADTDVQVKTIADAIRKGTESKPWHVEGYRQLNWVLLDYVDAVIHIFKTETRAYYELERLWADAPVRELNDEPEVLPDPAAE